MQLECRQLSYTYPGSRIPVIENLSFSMEKPGFKALFGPSGVGKTSLAKMIADPGAAAQGTVRTLGIGTILYSYNLERLPGWSGTGRHLEKVTPNGKSGLREELLDIFDLRDVIASRFSQLSMGQQNRINLVRYLVQEFDLLILDESLANVDEKLREKIILAIKERFGDKMFLYISHNLMEVSKFCSQILVFGKSSARKKTCMIRGQDYKLHYELDQTGLDRTMLEIMNAF